MIGDGCCAFVSISLGAGRREDAHKSIGSAVLLCVTVLSLVREVVFGVGFALLLPIWFGLDGVLYSMPVSDALTFLLGVAVIAQTYHFLNTTLQDGLKIYKN